MDASDAHGLGGDGLRLIGPPGYRQHVQQLTEPHDVGESGLPGEVGVHLQHSTEIPGSEAIGGGRPSPAPPLVEGVVAGIVLQRHGGLAMGCGGGELSDIGRQASSGV